MLKLVFMGTPDFAEKSLEALYSSCHEILAVVTNPDRPKGRGMKMIASPVKEFAIAKGIEKIYQPERIKDNLEFINTIKQLKPDIICVVAYGKILPKEILDIPKYGCINVHGSLLPRYRGAAPIQWAVLNGDKETGITTMYMNSGMDTGDIILTEKVKIGEDETTGELWQKLAVLGGNLLVETLLQIENKTAPRIKQGIEFSRAPMLNKEMAKIDWQSMPARNIKNLVRGLNPTMGAYTLINERKIKIWKVNFVSQSDFVKEHVDFIQYEYRLKNIEPGTIIYIDKKQGFFIKAIEGIIQVLEVQLDNSKKMSTQEFLKGNKLEVGIICE